MSTKKDDDDDVVDRFIKDAAEMSESSKQLYDEYRGRRTKELELWHKGNESGWKEQHVSPLLKSVQPLIKREADKRLPSLGGSIPRSALESELTNSALKSFKSYNPSRGVALTTHVVNGFQRISDFVNANRNAKYMPGADVKNYQAFQNANAELRDQLGRPPTAEELHPHLPRLSVRAIGRMQRGFGEELFTDMGDNISTGGEGRRIMSPRESFHLVHSQLSEPERAFGEMYFVPEGEKQPAVRNIAKALGIPPSRAYQIKARVETLAGKQRKNE